MRSCGAVPLTLFLMPGMLLAQAALGPTPAATPTAAEARAGMGIPSSGDVRGQRDTVGFASTAAQMAKVWSLANTPPPPEVLGDPLLKPGVAGVLCAHDDFLYAGRVYRRVLPLVTARTVVVIGVFHRHRSFAAPDRLVFDSYRAWRAPDGEVPVSPLRAALLAALPADDVVESDAMHDSEHSVEPLVYWLRHARADVEIVPILVPAMRFERMQALAGRLAAALASAMREGNLRLGRDVAVAISSDAVHYGLDFRYVPFGDGGVDAYVKACEEDRALLRGPLAGPIDADKARAFFATCVNPAEPSEYRLTWCGRFAVPLGMLTLAGLARDLGLPEVVGRPLAYSTSVGTPELPVRDTGLGATAAANLYHFVGYPGVAFTVGR